VEFASRERKCLRELRSWDVMLKINDILSQELEKFYKTNSVAREKNKYQMFRSLQCWIQRVRSYCIWNL